MITNCILANQDARTLTSTNTEKHSIAMYRFIFCLVLAKLPFTETYLEVHFPSPKQKADLQAELYSEKKNKEAF